MKYKCLVLDHDDTIVNSTATVNYPSFINTLTVLRPEINISLEEFFRYNFEPGFSSLCSEILHFSDKEMYFQTQNWLKYVMVHTPPIFEGIDRILWRFYNEGGYICVVSHSMNENILRDYRDNSLPMPNMVFGWDMLPEQRKPSVWAIQQIKERLSLEAADLVMIDDLKPGKVKADNAGINFIGAGWSHSIPEIVSYMKSECKFYCSTVKELEDYLF